MSDLRQETITSRLNWPISLRRSRPSTFDRKQFLTSLWWWLWLRLSKSQSLIPSTVFLRTTFTRTMRLHYQRRWLVLLKFNILHMLPPSSNHLLYCYVTWLFWTMVSNHNLWHLWSTTVSNFTSCRLLQDNLSYHRLTARIFLRPVNILRMVWYGLHWERNNF